MTHHQPERTGRQLAFPLLEPPAKPLVWQRPGERSAVKREHRLENGSLAGTIAVRARNDRPPRRASDGDPPAGCHDRSLKAAAAAAALCAVPVVHRGVIAPLNLGIEAAVETRGPARLPVEGQRKPKERPRRGQPL